MSVIFKHSLILLLFLLVVSWILFLLSIGTTSWLNIAVVDRIELKNDNSSTRQTQFIMFSWQYKFGLSSYCIFTKNSNTSSKEENCKKILDKPPDILKTIRIPTKVFSDLRKFMALTIILTTLALTTTIVGRLCTKSKTKKIIAFVSMAFICSAGILCATSIFICTKSTKLPSDVINTPMQSKYGTFMVNQSVKGYSFYAACIGNFFLLLALIFYVAELKFVKDDDEEEVVSYQRLSSANIVD